MNPTAENNAPEATGKESPSDHQEISPATLRFLHQANQRAYWETANLTAKGIAFYLAVTAALLSYYLNNQPHNLEQTALARLLLWGALLISAAVFVALGANAWLLFRQAKSLEALAQMLDAKAFVSLSIGRQSRHQRRVLAMVISAYCAVGAVLFAGLLILLCRLK